MNELLKDKLINGFVQCRNVNMFEDDIIDFFDRTGLCFNNLKHKYDIKNQENYIKEYAKIYLPYDNNIQKKKEYDYLIDNFKVIKIKYFNKNLGLKNSVKQEYNVEIKLSNNRKIIFTSLYNINNQYKLINNSSITLSNPFEELWNFNSNNIKNFNNNIFDNFPYNINTNNCNFQLDFNNTLLEYNKKLNFKYISYQDILYFFK